MRIDFDKFRRIPQPENGREAQKLETCRRTLVLRRRLMTAVNCHDGNRWTAPKNVEQVVRSIYTKLFSSSVKIPPPTLTGLSDRPPPEYVRSALQQLKKEKSPYKDGLAVGMLQTAGPTLWKAPVQHNRVIFRKSQFLKTQWNRAQFSAQKG